MEEEAQKTMERIMKYLDLKDASRSDINYIRLVLENLYSAGQVDGMRTIKRIYDTWHQPSTSTTSKSTTPLTESIKTLHEIIESLETLQE